MARRGGHALDLGSGTGFVTRALLNLDFTVDTVDFSFGSVGGARRHLQANLQSAPIERTFGCKYDLITSLATLHHVVECESVLPPELVKELSAVSRLGTQLILTDVPNLTTVHRDPRKPGAKAAKLTAEFFRDVVDPFSRPSHEGVYPDFSAIASQMSLTGWVVQHVTWVDCPWVFPHRRAAAEFLLELFGLAHEATAPVEQYLDRALRPLERGVALEWGLSQLEMRRAH